MSKIKLFMAGVTDNGTIRLQSQLRVGTDTADFIKENGVVKCWGLGEHGFDFYEYKEPYEIVDYIKGLKYQGL